MRFLISTISILLFGASLTAQKAWIEPDPTSAAFNPEAEITIFFDVSKSEDCPDLAQQSELFMWTWNPSTQGGAADGDPVNGNGTWDNSNDIMKWTNEGGGLFSFTMIPTEFYAVDAATVFEKDFSFLAKLRNGSGGVTACGEDKTEDIVIEAEPFVFAKKVNTFPEPGQKDTMFTSPNDFITLIYDKNLEDKQNILDADNYYVFLKAAATDGRTYTYAPPNQLDSKPELQLADADGDNKFLWTVQPEKFLSDLVPAGEKITSLKIQIAKEGAASTNDLVDGIFEYFFKCE